MATERGYRTIQVQLGASEVNVYTRPNLAAALQEILALEGMSLYHGVKLHQIMEAVYVQGKKDGAAAVFAAVDQGIAGAKAEIAHKRPGRPRVAAKKTATKKRARVKKAAAKKAAAKKARG
jgi:hypothetical protein